MEAPLTAISGGNILSYRCAPVHGAGGELGAGRPVQRTANASGVYSHEDLPGGEHRQPLPVGGSQRGGWIGEARPWGRGGGGHSAAVALPSPAGSGVGIDACCGVGGDRGSESGSDNRSGSHGCGAILDGVPLLSAFPCGVLPP